MPNKKKYFKTCTFAFLQSPLQKNSMRRLVFLLPIFFSLSIFAQNGATNSTGARSKGVADASVAFTGINYCMFVIGLLICFCSILCYVQKTMTLRQNVIFTIMKKPF